MKSCAIPSRLDVVLHLDALFHHGGLQIKLHPGSDGRADQADDHVQVVRVESYGGLDCAQGSLFPGRVGNET